MAQEPEMNKKCDREDDLSVYSVHPSVQKDEKMWNRKGKLEWKTNVKPITSKLKRKFGAICKKDKITTYPKEESLHGNFKEGANLKEIPSHLTNDRLGCEKKDAFAVPVPVVFQAFPEQKEPSLEKVILSRPNSGSSAYACQSSSNISSSGNKSDCENGTLDIEHVFNKNESFNSDTENKNVRNPLVTFEVKEDQEFDMRMSASMNQNSTNCKLDVGCIPPSSDLRRLFDFWLACFHEMRQMVQMKRHNISAVTNTSKKTKDSFQKPLNADNDSTNNYRSMEPELEHVSSSPSCSYRTSEVYRSEGLQPDILKCVNEMGLLLVEFVSLENENVQLQKEMVEERKRHESDKLAVSESIYAAAATGLIQQRASGKTDNHLCPVMEDEDSDGPAKKTSKEKKEIKKQINFTDDLDDLTPSSGTASEDCKLPSFDFRSCMLLIEQLGMDCKDSVNLLKIRNAVCSFERLLELKNDHCEQLTRKNKELEDSVNGLQKELSQTKEIKLQLEQQKVEWEQELCSLRFSFKREKEKRRNTDMLYEKIKEQLKRKVQQYNKEAELKQQLEVTLRTRDEELRTVRNNLNQLQEAQDRHAEAVRCIEKSKDHIQKPEVENAELKDRVKKQAGGIEELQENLLSTSSCDDKRGEMKKFIELKQSLEYCLDQEVKKNGQLEKEITRLKKLLSMTRSEVDDLTAKLETASSKCLQLDEKNQVLSQKLLSMKELQKKCEKLEKDKKKLEQQVVNLKSHAEVNMAEYSRIEQYKRELDKRARLDMEEKLREVNLFLQAQVASQESLGQLRDSNNALISSQMELRVKDLEFELSKMKSSQEHSNKTELEKYKELYFEEVKVRTSLTNELNRTNERLAEIRTKLLVEKQQKRNFLHTVTMSPVLELPYVRNISNRLPLDRHVAPRENVMIPPSSSWPSNNGIESYLLKVQKEFEKRISRELKAAAAELESDSSYYTSSFF
ncbi:ankyrin repeat domain-containing protein 26 isoform X3 [Ursus arctos]|nr:ankyrin repeat domain-containing protein 26 isoform X3 [Ursus arctos]